MYSNVWKDLRFWSVPVSCRCRASFRTRVSTTTVVSRILFFDSLFLLRDKTSLIRRWILVSLIIREDDHLEKNPSYYKNLNRKILTFRVYFTKNENLSVIEVITIKEL